MADDDFALPTNVLSREEYAALDEAHLDKEDWEAVDSVSASELAPTDGSAPCGEESLLDDDEEAPSEDFALPDHQLRTLVTQDGDDAEEGLLGGIQEPWECRIPSTIITQELQKAMYRGRLILHHTFEQVSSGDSNMLNRLVDEHPDAYVDAILRLAITHFITWQKGMGL